MRVSLNWLKDFVDLKADLEKVPQALTMTGLEVGSIVDVEDDKIMDIEITPNRPDCLSIIGVARELAAATNKSLEVPLSIKKAYGKKAPGRGSAKIEVQDKKACPRYVGCIIKNVKIGPSPKWLVQRLNAMGLRSINNVADITNYILFETGQPLHAFDLDKLEGKRIIVRKAKKGEGITTIDGIRRELDPNILVIADAASPVAIAGIMGGKDTEISGDTKTVLLESAYFDPIVVRKAQRKLGLVSESSYRFERGVDFSMVFAASARAQEMIRDIAGGRVSGTSTDVGGKLIKEKEVSLELGEISRVLGIEILPSKVADFLKQLDIKVVKKTKDKIVVKVPNYRQDLERDIDLIEEIVRLYGYDKVPTKIPTFTLQKTYEEEKKAQVSLDKKAKDVLISLGMNEIITYSLTSRFSVESLGISFDNLVRLENPLSSNQEFMRPSLLPEMLEVVSWNLNRRSSSLRLFELSKVYLKGDGDSVRENKNLCLGMCGATSGNWKEKSRDIDFFDLKGSVEVLLNKLGIKEYTLEAKDSFIFRDKMSSSIKIGEETIGVLGEVKKEIAKKFDIKQKVYVAEIYIENLLGIADLKKRFSPIPRYPSVKRDISILIGDSVASSSIFDLIKETGKDLVKSIDVFDLYKGQQVGEGKKSLAYTVEYRSDQKTLKDEDVTGIHKNIQDALVKKLNAQIR
ncbi:MAG: phenylalanine--tRNA ligase subunit beta [Candidatus Omnitrophica bacterium]|nr:phenylalanine--tRNA ligase subunit beta [Candidatus Omnitrophota bacterium]MBU4589524.1 phenylalanine--tRNA ligase subunit beta [Candidatus Omnitrophota bacterium]